ncbi:MAG: TraM recognition domain-containing protein, partial [Bacteroidota bacterium]
LTPYDQLFTMLNTEPEIETLIAPFIDAYKNKSMEMLDGQLASAKIPLGRLASPDLYYVLTGDDCSLDINNPMAPKILCLGVDPPRQEALAPVLSLYIDRLNKLVNQSEKVPCALVCDEFATVRAASMLTTIATARSNHIIPVLSVQDLSQLRTQYSREEADLIANITGNLVCGQVGGETARWVSERFPTTVQYRKSVSVNSSDTSISRSEQEVNTISAATIATLSSGEFVGIVADDPDRKIEHKAFHARIVKDTKSLKDKNRYELPVVREVDETVIGENFQRVKKEIKELVVGETQRIVGDPALAKKVVKR